MHVAARKSVARNRGSAPTVLPEELARYEGVPGRGFPAAFEVNVHVLGDDLGGFASRGHEAYGDRMRAWAQATIDGWQGRSGAS